jgi:F420-non-reducing hydrogenase large subunit
MGTVDENNKVNFYDGKVSVVDPEGQRIGKYAPNEYTDWIAEHVEPWTYLKFPYLKKIGWKGFVDGKDSGVYCATPLSRLNVSDGMATPLAQEAYEKFYDTLTQKEGEMYMTTGHTKVVHQRLATHWARLVELLYSAERIVELATDPEIASDNFHTVPTEKPTEGVESSSAARHADASLLDGRARRSDQG